MTLEVLLSCMHQSDDSLVRRSGLTGDVLLVSQGGGTFCKRFNTLHGTARVFGISDHGLTKSRNWAIAHSQADVCLLCDDDEVFVPDYETRILNAYAQNPTADLIIFKMANQSAAFSDKPRWLHGLALAHIASWQISFQRQRLLDARVKFDELLGAGSGNGAEEELKFLLDCRRAGLRILYVPIEIASVAQTDSTWFHGFDEAFFENRGATTRYILGLPLSLVYGLYYVAAKRRLYAKSLSPCRALRALLRGIGANHITRQAKALRRKEGTP